MRPIGECKRLKFVYHRVRDAGSTLFLGLPTRLHDGGELSQVAQQQCLLHLHCFLLQPVHGIDGCRIALANVARLLVDDLRGSARDPGEIQDQAGLKLVPYPALDAQRIHDDPVFGIELHEIETTEGSRILILLAA